MLSNVKPRIITVDLSSLYDQQIDLDLLTVSDIMTEIPNINEVEPKRMLLSSFGSTSQASMPAKYPSIGEYPLVKSFQGLPEHEIIEGVRRSIMNCFNLSDIIISANAMLCSSTMIHPITKVCNVDWVIRSGRT